LDEVAGYGERLESIVAALSAGGSLPSPTVREFLRWFGAQKRGAHIVRQVRRALRLHGLVTIPDFESTWIDGPITFALAKTESSEGIHRTQASSSDIGPAITSVPPPPSIAPMPDSPSRNESPSPAVSRAKSEPGPPDLPAKSATLTALLNVESPVSGTWEVGLFPSKEFSSARVGVGDPTYRISKLEAANRTPVSVKPDSTLREVVTVLLANDFSQVPVMPNEREVKGVASWQSIGSRVALGQAASTAREVMDVAAEIRSDASIFAAIPSLIEYGYVLVRGPENRIAGIVTTSDLSLQFGQLAEPFLLLSEIENRIRNIIASHFSTDELTCVRDPNDAERVIESVDDLSFGEYMRLLEEPGRWERVAPEVDRTIFIKSLDNIRVIRNDVMHFDPDGISQEDSGALRDFAKFLQKLEVIGVTGP
jgi:CBS domain-containing protein